jgi:hypothetical protein
MMFYGDQEGFFAFELLSLDIKRGDEIRTPSMTFASTLNRITPGERSGFLSTSIAIP